MRSRTAWAYQSTTHEGRRWSAAQAFLRKAEGRGNLAKVRALSYAHSRDELQLGVHGLAAPICGADGIAQASVGILVPQSRATNLMSMAGPLVACAKAIGAKLSA